MSSWAEASDNYILPSVLDRLISSLDDNLDLENSFIKSVERDVLLLFNENPRLDPEEDELSQRYPNVATSVLCCGLRHIFGKETENFSNLETLIERAIEVFEPRIELSNRSFEFSREGQLVEIKLEGTLKAYQGRRQQLWIRTNLETLESTLRSKSNG